MKTTIRKAAQFGIGAAVALCLVGVANAQLYDNTTSALDQYYSPGNDIWFGDQVNLISSGTITEFAFQTFGNAAISGGTANLRFYLNDGAVTTDGLTAPGTQLYESGPFAITSGLLENRITGLNIDLGGADTFTWAVNFSSDNAAESGALTLYDPPTVGSSFNDFWVMDGGGNWSTEQFPGGTPVANFNAQVVPEPTTLVLGLLGGLGLLVARLRRKA